MKKNKTKTITGGLVLIAVAGFLGFYFSSSSAQKVSGEKINAVLYKSPTCGCCVEYTAYLKDKGFNVEKKLMADLSPIKEKYQISEELESCHTMVVDGYFIEGHVPIEAIQKLLSERPDIEGIGLAGMPSGSPGMPGPKLGDFVIYSLKAGVYSEFMRL